MECDNAERPVPGADEADPSPWSLSFLHDLPQSHIPLHIPDFQSCQVLVAPVCFEKSWWHPAIAPVYAKALPQETLPGLSSKDKYCPYLGCEAM